MKYSEIRAIALSLPQYFDIRDYRDHDYNKIERIELLFTVHGNYCGDTICKSNYHVLLDRLSKISNNLGNIKIIESYYSTKYLAIIGGIKNELWVVINEALESLENYPLLSDDHYSDQEQKDCYDSWDDWQYDDIENNLIRYHDIDLENFDLDNPDKLLNFLSENNFFDQIANTEENSCSHWHIEDDNIADIATLINDNFVSESIANA